MWVTVDSCDKCGQTADITWSGIESNGHTGYTRIDCPNRCP